MSTTILQRSLALLTVLAAVTGVASAQPSTPRPVHVHSAPVCTRGAGVTCHAHVVTDSKGSPLASTTPAGYGPAQLRGGYNLPSTSATPATIAIVDAYDDPSIKSDLDTYSRQFGLPVMPTCTSTVTTSCFKKLNQRGGTSYPAASSGWSLEIALDVEVAHAICPNCSLTLVEADSNSFANLMTAVDTAVASGAKVVSNSYGASEFSGETTYDAHFNHPGVAITVSSGDNGYGVEYPAASRYVTAVGGTTLKLSGTTRVSETAWSGAGSGCSLYEAKPAVQTDACTGRTVADVSADADPATGAAVYDSVRYQGRRGWFAVGGTSLASPLVAGVYGLAGGVPAGTTANTVPYAHTTNLFDVTTGSNGACGSYLCSATTGFDGPTGLGTPNGLLAF
jgi:subtilase family serine protease